MHTKLENVSWVRDATEWSQETSFIVGNLLREIAKKDQIIKDLTKRLLEK